MNNLLDKLLLLLKKEVSFSEELLNILQNEKKLLIDLELKALEENNQEKEVLLLKIARLEEERIDMLKEVSPELGIPLSDNLTLLSLSKLVGDPYAFSLRDSYNYLRPLLDNIKQANQENMSLLHHALSNVQESISFLNGLIQEDPTYAHTGTFQNQKKNGRSILGKV